MEILQFIYDNIWLIAYLVILCIMSPEVAIAIIIAIMMIGGAPPNAVIIIAAIIAALIRNERISDKLNANHVHYTFSFNKKDEGE